MFPRSLLSLGLPGARARRPLLLAVSIAPLLGGADSSTLATAEPPPSVSTPAEAGHPFRGVVLLIDGGVLSGEIRRAADQYIVVVGTGEVHVPIGKVRRVCRSLQEAYQQQRDELARPTADDAVRLAEWCLRHHLATEAHREITEVRRLDPQHSKLPLLERRLVVATRPAPDLAAASSLAAAPQPPAPAPGDAPAPPPAPALANQQFKAVAGQLPPGAVQHFMRKVQPVLVNNCTTAGCHQLGGQQTFQLDRALVHGLANRRSSTHNLAAALALVDRGRPQQSPLLAIPPRDHGGLQSPLFTQRHAQQYAHLVDWVLMLSDPAPSGEEFDDDRVAGHPANPRVPMLAGGDVEVPRGDSLDARPATEGVRLASASGIGRDAAVRSAAHWEDAPAAAGEHADRENFAPDDFDDEEMWLLPAEPRPLQRGAEVRPFRPKDPFDPEIFNRQRRAPAGR